jgi:hypothetical protein
MNVSSQSGEWIHPHVTPTTPVHEPTYADILKDQLDEWTLMMIDQCSSSLSVRSHMEKQTQILTRLATPLWRSLMPALEDGFTPEGDFVHALDFVDDNE